MNTEHLIKEYPNSTRWVEGQQVVGVGNLILTNRRLIFLHQVALTDQQVQRLQELTKKGKFEKITEFALDLHRKNFQIPLEQVVLVKVGRYSLLPFPRPCLRISYANGKEPVKIVSFMFTIPLWKSFFEFEIVDVMAWVRMIRRILPITHAPR